MERTYRLFDGGVDTWIGHHLLFDNFSVLMVLGIVVLENIPMVRQSCLKSRSVKALMVGIKGGVARSLKVARATPWAGQLALCRVCSLLHRINQFAKKDSNPIFKMRCQC